MEAVEMDLKQTETHFRILQNATLKYYEAIYERSTLNSCASVTDRGN